MKLLNTEKTYRMLQPFESIEQLNANTKAIRLQFGEFMTTSMLNVLDVLHRYASKFYGVCYLAKSSIAKMVGLSTRQVVRICNTLGSMGIIAQYQLDRANGDKRQSSNAIVFLTQISAREAFGQVIEVVSDNMQCHTECHTNTLNQTPKKDLNNTYDTGENAALIKNGLVSKLPETLKYVLAPFFDAEELYEMVGVIYKAKASVDRDIQIEDHEDTFRETILSVINAFKRGKVKSLPAVLYSAIKKTTRGIYNRQLRYDYYGFLG